MLDARTLSGDVADLCVEVACASPDVQVISTDPDHGAHLEIGEPDHELDLVPITVVDGTSTTHSRVWPRGQWMDLAEIVRQEDDVRLDAVTVRDALVLGRAAGHAGGDVLVTQDPSLLGPRARGLLRDSNPLTPEEALSLMGLLMRSRGSITVSKARSMSDFWFYMVLAQATLPEVSRVRRAAWQHEKLGDRRAVELAFGVRQRVESVIRSRDAVQLEQLRTERGSQVRALHHLDAMVMFAGGAFDAAAQLVDLVYGLGGGGEVSWRRKGWRKLLRRADGDVDALMAAHTPGGDLLEVISLLRNTIHTEPLDAMAFERSSMPVATMARIHPPTSVRFLAAVRRLGIEREIGLEMFSGTSDDGDQAHLDVRLCTEWLVEAIPRTIDSLLGLLEVERLDGVDPVLLAEPEPRPHPWDEATGRSVRLLAGLGRDGPVPG